MFVRIEENKSYYRDTETGALLNTNIEELKAYYAERDLKLKDKEEKEKLQNKVDKLEQDVTEIKNLLHQLVAKS